MKSPTIIECLRAAISMEIKRDPRSKKEIAEAIGKDYHFMIAFLSGTGRDYVPIDHIESWSLFFGYSGVDFLNMGRDAISSGAFKLKRGRK